MRTKFDQLSKGIFGEVGSRLGEVRTQYEIVGEVQAADLVFWPDEARAGERSTLGLMGRMLSGPCMLECFHDTPTRSDLRACIIKLFTEQQRCDRRQSEHAGPELPSLWIVSAGRPDSLLRELECKPLDGWGPGMWQPNEFFSTRFVVVRDLPETRDTLLVRLQGAGRTLRRALAELRALQGDAWEVKLAMEALVAFRIEVEQNPTEDAMEYLEELHAFVNQWKQEAIREGLERGRVEGLEKGRVESLRDSLLRVYRARFGQKLPALAAAIDAADLDTLLRWLPLFATGTRDDIAHATRTESR